MEMVVGASEATMKSLLSKLGGLLAHEYALIRGDIQYINDEMASMQAFLGDLAPRGHDRRMKDWMKQIRDVTYDIEDCVDDFAHRLPHDPAAGRDVCCAFLVSPAYEIWTWWPRRTIASSIAELKVRAQQIGERRTRYGVENPKSLEGESGGAPSGFNVAEYQNTTLALVGTKKPVGVKEKMKELGDEYLTLQSSKQAHAVLSIVGFGGVGKTTIATALYQEYGDQFDRRATVTVSQSSDIDAILLIILSQVKPQSKDDNEQQGSSGGGPSGKKRLMAAIGTVWASIKPKGGEQQGGKSSQTTQDLKQQLDDCLKEKSYLLLVDDVWSATMWETIKKSLPRNTKGSRVIVTTRFQAVASACRKDKGDHIHKVVVLDGHKSEELFRTESGISEDKPKEISMTESGIGEDKPKESSMTESGISENKPKESSMTESGIGEDKPKESSMTESGISENKPKESSMTESGIGEDKPKESSMAESGISENKPKESSMAESGKQNQEKIPPRLWQMCGGLPLAIVTMAGHAACNTEKPIEEWTKVCNTLVPGSTKALGQDGVTRILSHCYNDMPGEIKTCSLYLCIFPKGRRVSRKRLTRRWLAEGFVSEKDGLSAEDVAEAYFNYLVRRKIIRVVEHSSNGKVKSYQVHDMVLEYIISKASEENFVTVVGGHWLMAPPSNKVRRLSLQDGDSKHKKTIESMNLSHVRSLTMFRSLTQLPSNSLKFGIVQVLDLEGCKDFRQHHAKDICKMLLLKYLSLRRTDINKIPKKIGKLQYLETLDIRETNVTELPNAVCQLERVVNILGGNKRTRKALKLPENLKKKTMKNLRILSGIEIVEGPAAVADFHHLTDLRKLTIYKLNIKKGFKLFEDLSSSIEYLGGYSLHTLVIDDESSEFLKSLAALSTPPKFLNALELSGKLVELPEWITELDALTKLTLSVTVLTADALQQLSKLKTLFSLTFSLTSAKLDQETTTIIEENKEDSGGEIIFPAGGFDNLKLLRFSAPSAPLLSFPENALPKLERLELRFSMLEGLYGLENLTELKEVHLRVHDKAGEFTKSLIEEMISAAREDDKGARIIVDQYHV